MRQFIKNAVITEISAAEWFAFYEEKAKTLFLEWAPTIVNDFFTFKFYDYLNRMVLSYGFSENENLTNDLLCGLEEVHSESLVLTLLSLKEEVNADDELIELFSNAPGQIIELLNDDTFVPFRKKFYDFIEIYGDRTFDELKLESENLRMKPELLAGIIKSHLNNDISVQSFREKQLNIKIDAERKIRSRQFPLSVRTALFNIILRQTRMAIRNRENMRFCRTRAYGLVKDIFYEIGVHLQKERVIDKPRDIFYLDLKDIQNYCMGHNITSKIEFIAGEKTACEAYVGQSLPDRIMYQGDSVPLPLTPAEGYNEVENVLYGNGISKGVVEGQATVVIHPDTELKVEDNILVSSTTDPGWIFLMVRAKGLVSEKGSSLSHTAIIGRELGIPTIVGVENATRAIKTGNIIRMDGSSGSINILSL